MKKLSLFCTIMVLMICLFLITSGIQSQESRGVLRAGIAKIDITPEKPVRMSGYSGRKELSDGVHDPLSIRVVVFENSGKRLVLVSSDIIGFGRTYEYFQKAIADEFNLEQSELFLSGIHTHSAPTPTLDKERVHPNNVEYTEGLKPKLIKVIREALDSMSPVQIGAGIGYSPVGMNRRMTTPDGPVTLGCNPYGPTDKEVLVIKLARPNGTPIGALFDYACHATSLGPRNLKISGDVLGLAAQFTEKILGNGLIAPEFAGASGNIDPWFRVLPAFNTEPGWIPEPVLLGTLLGEEVVHIFRDIKELSTGGEIKTEFRTLNLPSKKRDESTAQKTDETTPLNITAAQVGDIAFIGFSCEMLTEIGMAIKEASPYKHTFLITHCNGGSGYLPPAHLYKEGGYEVRSTRFAPQAADMVVKEALKMLYGL